MIIVQDIHKSYRTGLFGLGPVVPVLRGFDFKAHPGEVVGVLGPNGAGKTTFFRVLCGLERIQLGNVQINGVDPQINPQNMRGKIALLPENAGLSPTDIGVDHLHIFGLMMGLKPADIRQRLNGADEHLQLQSFWKRPFSSYSRGQKARIALARLNLMPEANVYIFDEPSNGLDFEAVSRVHKFIRNLARDGNTVLLASHIISDLRHVCDRLTGIVDGRAASNVEVQDWLDRHLDSVADLVPKEADIRRESTDHSLGKDMV